ncbi:MAG: UPF0182 family protein [Alphaproteobacteria bacterium]|nr:UPF0182 family protein [Alphaproteobacteria bacterium]
MLPKRLAILLVAVVVGLIMLARTGDALVDWLWFSSLGYAQVFWTIFYTRSGVFLASFVLAAAAIGLSGWLALRHASAPIPPMLPSPPPPHAGIWWTPPQPAGSLGLTAAQLPWRLLLAGAALLLGLLAAGVALASWDTVLRFLYGVSVGQADPVFGHDLGFYLFSLPAWMALKSWLLLVLALSAVVAGVVYWAHDDIALDKPRHLSPAVLVHGSALLVLYFLIKAWSYWLDRYLLLYGDNGVVFGAAYTDLAVRLPVLWLLMALALAGAIVCGVNLLRRTLRLPLTALVVLFGSSLIFYGFASTLFQRLYVRPNELALETPYMQRTIALTRQAYQLQQIEVKPFPVEEGLTAASLDANRATIDNIRLWDWAPLRDTYAQLQEIRTYYKFLDIDVDRYRLGDSYQQVMLSARELEPSLLPSNAQTWVNLHLLFTHGNGVVMSPVTRKTSEGLPTFYLQDIPPVSTGGPEIREPRLYFGEASERYVIVRGSTQEFDYPRGNDNVYASYDGADGVGVGDVLRRSLFAWYYGDPNILLSDYITPQSRILLHRNVQERLRTLAPLLQLDHDPYVVMSEGRLFWIQDAYTTSDWFPYAQPQTGGGLNYIRNSVKAVVDAYNGTVELYVSDPNDPLIQAYQRMFPGLFKPLAAMPADLKRHIRYPEDLFRVQTQLYRVFHMESPEVFYNREDLWQFPRQPGGIDESASAGPAAAYRDVPRMAPYYMIMRLPGEARAEYVQMLPMVPSQRENMIAWMAARCDAPEYGKVIVYQFPKDKQVYGPFQIEARIQQNTDISQQISLWNQMGSRVIRGHLLVVPIDHSILYVSPLYLRAATGQLPELKRVIAAYGDRVVMEETLGAALAALFKDSGLAQRLGGGVPASATATAAGPVDERAREALAHYDRALERLKAGDWAGFGSELDALKPLLEALAASNGAH